MEFIIWGCPHNETDENILYTLAESHAEANKVIQTLEKDHGCTGCRVQEFDPTAPPDFINIFNK